jgi:hypothetical protein
VRRLAAGLAFAAALAMAGQAAAWGGAGHQLTGAIADQLLNANAKAKVAQILGISLHDAAPWPDCVRQVNMFHGQIQWNPTVKPPAVCVALTTPAGIAEMVAYAKANWDQCSSPDPSHPCHTQYHFADIPEADQAYALSRRPGAGDHDVVHTIKAAVLKLEGKTPPKPFASLTDRQALFLLAHMVGDLHQPLHVGALYLNPDGTRVDAPPKKPPATMQTIGGNVLMYTKSEGLHGLWDSIPDSFGTDGTPYVAEAQALPATAGNFHDWPARWASDSVAQAHSPAFLALAFGAGAAPTDPTKTGLTWPITGKPATYADILHAEQRTQIIKGGRHLADLLNAIWPAQ